MPKFSTGELKPIIDSEFPLEKISEAHQLMESNKSVGKILLRVHEDGHSEL